MMTPLIAFFFISHYVASLWLDVSLASILIYKVALIHVAVMNDLCVFVRGCDLHVSPE